MELLVTTWRALLDKSKDQFEGKARFSQNFKTNNFAVAANMAEPHLAKWNYMIQMARHKSEGHVIDLNETAEAYNK